MRIFLAFALLCATGCWTVHTPTNQCTVEKILDQDGVRLYRTEDSGRAFYIATNDQSVAIWGR